MTQNLGCHSVACRLVSPVNHAVERVSWQLCMCWVDASKQRVRATHTATWYHLPYLLSVRQILSTVSIKASTADGVTA